MSESSSINGSRNSAALMGDFDAYGDVQPNTDGSSELQISVNDGQRPPNALRAFINTAFKSFLGLFCCFKGSPPAEPLRLGTDDGAFSTRTMPALSDAGDTTGADALTQPDLEDQTEGLPARQGPRFSFFYSDDGTDTEASDIDPTKLKKGTKEHNDYFTKLLFQEGTGEPDAAPDVSKAKAASKQAGGTGSSPINQDEFLDDLLRLKAETEQEEAAALGTTPPPNGLQDDQLNTADAVAPVVDDEKLNIEATDKALKAKWADADVEFWKDGDYDLQDEWGDYDLEKEWDESSEPPQS